MIKHLKFLTTFFLAFTIDYPSIAQDSIEKKSRLFISGFVDTYYSYDFNKPANHLKPPFLYNHNRHNEFNVNLVLVSLAYNDSKIRSTLALMAGTYPQYNLASEPDLLRNIYEANAGVKVSKKKNLWIDAGIFSSHIGFESAISNVNWTLTRSILAENSPYYEAGFRASYKSVNENWYAALFLLNGWQRIRRVEGNNTPAFGSQLTYTPSGNVCVTSSTFVGNDKPDSLKKWRYFHNAYVICQVSNHWGITAGFDIGGEQKNNGPSDLNIWYSPVAIIRYQNKGWSVAGRAEYYSDSKGVIIELKNASPFQVNAYSINLDKAIGNNLLWRMEYRMMKNSSKYFTSNSSLTSRNAFLTSSLAISL